MFHDIVILWSGDIVKWRCCEVAKTNIGVIWLFIDEKAKLTLKCIPDSIKLSNYLGNTILLWFLD
jgi:hypothetical protein